MGDLWPRIKLNSLSPNGIKGKLLFQFIANYKEYTVEKLVLMISWDKSDRPFEAKGHVTYPTLHYFNT